MLFDSSSSTSKLHEIFSEMYKKIEHTSSHPKHSDVETVFANGFFVHQDHPILNSFIESMKKYYNANVTNLDFAGHPEEATKTINE